MDAVHGSTGTRARGPRAGVPGDGVDEAGGSRAGSAPGGARAAVRGVLGALVTVAALPGGITLTVATSTGGWRLVIGASGPGGDPAAAIAGLAALIAAIIAGWLTLSLALVLLAGLPGRAGALARIARDRVTPAIVRRWAAIVLGASVTATVVPGTAVAAVRVVEASEPPAPGWRPAAAPSASSTASPTSPSAAPSASPSASPSGPTGTTSPGPASGSAATAPTPGWATRPTVMPSPTSTGATSPSTTPTAPPTTTSGTQVTVTPPSPGWTPSRPPTRQRTDPTLLTGRPRPASSSEVVVRRGDTLWSIVAARLGPGATAAEIAATWPRWHAANAAVIGPDPHLLLPGVRLAPPTDHDAPGTVPATEGTR
ncbi:LysM peptidoglycan-binding domain-containing protein [Janibacter sp. G349]|uniref:LysM peptidoglycan-binding domain-containing protein n=1 Tax=Janibacter sp. G349 TaxID=3405424 RepID=UPI003B77E1F3